MTLTVTDTGTDTITGVLATLTIASGDDIARINWGPSPSASVYITPGTTRSFTWSVSPTGKGTVRLVGRANGYINSQPYYVESSAILVGWGAVAIAMVLEKLYQYGIGAACACVVGFVTLLIAHHLGSNGDTLEMMTAVLDSNIWLATHVVVITLGYSTMFLAGMLAVAFPAAQEQPGVHERGDAHVR